MERVQLVEFEDLSWVPSAIRDGGTDLLDFGFQRLGFYRGVVPKLASFLDETGSTRMLDVCSGGGGGALQALDALRAEGRDVHLTLTDRFPSSAGMARASARENERLAYHPTPVDALAIPAELEGVRTMWGALHHFPPPAIEAMLASIVRSHEPLAFFDVAASPALRKVPIAIAPLAVALNVSTLFVASVVMVPFISPFRASRWAFTYLMPLVPLLVAWDGTVSALRAYAPDELLAIARSVRGGDAYEWEAGVGGPALYLTGRPRTPR